MTVETQAQHAQQDEAGHLLVPALLVVLAAAVRGVAAWQTAVIFNDGPHYLRIAGLFHAGDFGKALAHDYHPLYPLLVAWVAPMVGGLERAGVVVSIGAGSLAVLGLFAFLAQAFGRRTAIAGGLLLALHPYAALFSSDVQSEGLYLAFFLAAASFAWRGWVDEDLRRVALAGALAGGAYLVRPEGLGVAAAAAAFGALRLYRGRVSIAVFAKLGGALAAGAMIVALPYLAYLHDATGEWRLTRKKSVTELVAPEGTAAPGPSPGQTDRPRFRQPPRRRPQAREASILPARIEFEPRSVSAIFDLGAVSIGALHPLVVLLVVLGIASVRGPPGDRALFLALVIGLYAVVFYGLALNVGYLDRRHVLAPLLLLLGYAALGLPVLGGWLLRAFRPRGDPRDLRVRVWVAVALFALVTLPKTWAPHREERLASRRAAEWLAAQQDLRGPVASEKHRTAWYAGEAFVHLARAGPRGDLEALSRAGARFLVVDDVQAARMPGLAPETLTPRELHRVEAGGRTAWVFDLQPAAVP